MSYLTATQQTQIRIARTAQEFSTGQGPAAAERLIAAQRDRTALLAIVEDLQVQLDTALMHVPTAALSVCLRKMAANSDAAYHRRMATK